MSKGKQVSFKFDSEQVVRLKNIQKQLHTSSQAEAIRRSLNLTSVLASAEEKGYKILIEDDQGNVQQLVIA